MTTGNGGTWAGHNLRNAGPYTHDRVVLLDTESLNPNNTPVDLEVSGTLVVPVAGIYNVATFVLEIGDATAGGDASDTLDVFIQRQLPNGDWDDIVAFTQVVGTDTGLTFIADVFPGFDGEVYATDSSDGELTPGTIRNVPWYGRLRVKWDVTVDNNEVFDFAVYAMFRTQ